MERREPIRRKQRLPDRGDSHYSREIVSVGKLMPGEWSSLMLAVDRAGKIDISGVEKWTVR